MFGDAFRKMERHGIPKRESGVYNDEDCNEECNFCSLSSSKSHDVAIAGN